MKGNWKQYKFSEFAEQRKEQVAPNGEEQPYIGLEHIEQQKLRITGIGSSKDVISNKYKFYTGDILYGKLRPYFRKVYHPKFNGVCSTDIFVIVNKKPVDKDFLYYLVATEDFTSIANSGSSGTRMPRADWNQLAKSEWNIPQDLNEQKALANILSTLDDKIELNREMNQTLEDLCQSIFKEWFVNFNFPGFDGELKDGLPKEWRKLKLNKLISIEHGFAFKGEYFSDDETDKILLSPGNFKIGGGFSHNKFKYYLGEVSDDYVLSQNDLIITMTDLSKAGDTLGFPALVPEISGKKLLHNQRLGKIIFKNGPNLKYYLYLVMRQKEYRHFVLGSATGSTVKHTSPTRVCDYDIILPDDATLNEFTLIVKSICNSEQENLSQNTLLENVRDSLLPKLITGKIEIKE